jgi:SAC3 family protein LENG8/THP3
MVEYNACQAMLKTLYELGIPGKVSEFTAYQILFLLHGRNTSGRSISWFSGGHTSQKSLPELNLYVGQLTPKQKSDPVVQHALNVQKSQAIGNYHRLFELYLSAPNMGAYIMDHFIDRERVKALIAMAKAHVVFSQHSHPFLTGSNSYRTISLSFIAQELAWDTAEEARDFLIAQGAAFFTNPNSPDTEKELEGKPTVPQLTRSFEEKYRKVGIKGAI